MYNYHFPMVGISMNPNYKHSEFNDFIKEVYNFVREYDYDSTNDFSSEHISEYISELNKPLKYETKVRNFINWVENNVDSLEFSTYYHGGSNFTPMSLEFKNKEDSLTIEEFDDLDNYTLSKSKLVKISDEVQDFTAFCSRTMDKELYQFFQDNSRLGLTFINIST